MKRSGKISFWLLVVAGVLALGGNALAGEWGDSERENETLAVKLVREVQRGGYQLVTTGEFKEWADQKRNMIVIDTMPFEKSYRKNHIPGALQMEFPMEEMTALDPQQQEQLEKLLGPDRNATVVFYCGFTKCPRSHNAAMWAVKLGYDNVYRLPGGIKAWLEAGYPVAKKE